jgi:hypothetical protein
MKATKELLLELKEIPPGELLMAVMLLSTMAEVIEFGKSLPAPLLSDFARAAVNAPEDMVESVELSVSVCELCENEYPELYEFLIGISYGDSDDFLP